MVSENWAKEKFSRKTTAITIKIVNLVKQDILCPPILLETLAYSDIISYKNWKYFFS